MNSEQNYCSCGACYYKHGEWWIPIKGCREVLLGDELPLSEVLPDNCPLRCPRCFDELHKDGTTTPAIVGAFWANETGLYCSIDTEKPPPTKPTCYAILPLAEGVEKSDDATNKPQ